VHADLASHDKSTRCAMHEAASMLVIEEVKYV
jgi:hypothetical protein